MSGYDLSFDNFEEEMIQKNQRIEKAWDNDIEKSWSKDLQNKFPSGKWITMSGAKVFVNNGKVIAGLDGFKKEIDKLSEKKGETKGENKEDREEKQAHEMSSKELADWNINQLENRGLKLSKEQKDKFYNNKEPFIDKIEHAIEE